MAAPVQPYAAGRHHVGLGDDADSLIGLLLTGAYSRAGQQIPFSRASDVGQDALIGSDRLSVWTQRDYTGGEFQAEWSDEAMFDSCGFFIANPLGLGLRSVPGIVPIEAGQGFGQVTPKTFDYFDGQVWATYINEAGTDYIVTRFLNPDNRVNPIISFKRGVGLTGTRRGNCAAWNLSTRRLWVGHTGQAGIRVFSIQEAPGAGSGGFNLIETTTLSCPVDANFAVTSIQDICIFGPLRLVSTVHDGAHDRIRVWNHVAGSSGSNAKWAPVGTLPGDVVTSCVYNNQVYYLTRNGDGLTQLSMTNGSQIFPVLTFPYYFRGTSLAEYSGRLYVGGHGYDLEGNRHYGELHEINGTSLRLVRTFKTEAEVDSGRSAMRQLDCLGVAEGLLWFPDDSCGGLEAYDATSDAFFGGPRLIRAPSRDRDFGTGIHLEPFYVRPGGDPGDPVDTVTIDEVNFKSILTLGSSLLVWASSPKDFASGLYRVLEDQDDDAGYSPYVITSDFGPEPGRPKSWSQMVAITRHDSPDLQASVDSGDTWVSCPVVTTESHGGRTETTYDVSALPPSKVIRLKLIFQRDGTAGEEPVELLAHSLSYSVHSTGKAGFTFTVNLAENIETLDFDAEAEEQTDTLKVISDWLWTAFAEGRTLLYRDPDGVDHKATMTNLVEHRQQLVPTGERFTTVSLLEL